MTTAIQVVLGTIALLHAYFFVLEALLWQTPKVRKTFAMSAERAEHTAVLAKNQGVYNLFLSAGCAWAILHPDPAMAKQLGLFFAGCVLVAGLVGAATVSRRILFIQGGPAALALALLLAA